MFNKIASITINASLLLVAAGLAVWLALTGHALQVEGLLLTMGAILGAVTFGFRLADGADSGRLSIWAGPVGSIRRGGKSRV